MKKSISRKILFSAAFLAAKRIISKKWQPSNHDEEYVFEEELVVRDFDEEEKQKFFKYDELVGPRGHFGINPHP